MQNIQHIPLPPSHTSQASPKTPPPVRPSSPFVFPTFPNLYALITSIKASEKHELVHLKRALSVAQNNIHFISDPLKYKEARNDIDLAEVLISTCETKIQAIKVIETYHSTLQVISEAKLDRQFNQK